MFKKSFQRSHDNEFYNTWTILLNKYNVNANLDASDNVI